MTRRGCRRRRPRRGRGPTMAWPAIAIASRHSARNHHNCHAIWCAAICTSPIRAAIALAVVNANKSDAVRTVRCAPMTAAERTRSRRGRADACARRTLWRTMARYAAAAPICATTVPHADPATPRWMPYTSTTSSARLKTFAATAMYERRARVLEAAQVTGAREREQHERRAEQRDAEVRERVRRDVCRRAHRVHDDIGGERGRAP